jgi:hypothetical protein
MRKTVSTSAAIVLGLVLALAEGGLLGAEPAPSVKEAGADYLPAGKVEQKASSPRITPPSYWLGATWPHEEKCMQQMVSDLIVCGDTIYANSTMSENGSFASIFKTDGTWIGRLLPNNGKHNEGGYAIATDGKYVFMSAKVLDWDAKANKPVTHLSIRRFFLDGRAAPFKGGVNDGADLALLTTGTMEGWDAGWPFVVDDFHKVRGLAVYEGELFAANPVAKEIQVFDCETMEKKAGRSFPFANPGQLAFDRDGFLWILTMPNGAIKKYTRGQGGAAGVFTGTEIKDVKAAIDICVDPQGRLLVADNGVDRQQIRFYDTSGKFLKSWGEPTYAQGEGVNP